MKNIVEPIVNRKTKALFVKELYILSNEVKIFYQKNILKIIDKPNPVIKEDIGLKPGVCCHCFKFMSCHDCCTEISVGYGDIIEIKGLLRGYDNFVIAVIKTKIILLDLGWIAEQVNKKYFSLIKPEQRIAS